MLRSSWLGSLVALFVPACIIVDGDDTGGDSVGDTTTATTTVGEATSDPGDSGGQTSDGSTSSDPPGTTTSDTTDPPATTTTTADTGNDVTGGGEMGGGTIDVTLDGCDVDLGGTVVVSYNGSLGVASVYDGGATLTGSFQFELDGAGTMELSTQHRVDTGNVVNMVEIAQGTWTNLDADSLAGGMDRIGGTLVINEWDPASGISDIELQSVSLLNVVNGNVCTIDGTIVTTELYP